MTRAFSMLWLPLACIALLFAGMACPKPYQPSVPQSAQRDFQRGVGLGLFASDAEYNYGHLLDEITQHGATDVLIVVAWYQKNISAIDLAPRPEYSPSIKTIERTIAQARARNLRVTLLPIIRLSERTSTEWRGKISPSSVEKWFDVYSKYILEMARVAQAGEVVRFGVGSELLPMEKHREEWKTLITQVRSVYQGKLYYSANWDHFDPVTFWDQLDEVGVTAYFELVKDGEAVTRERLLSSWKSPRAGLAALEKRINKPLFITEIGYPSKTSAARFPWDETRDAPIDLEQQRLLFEVFCEAFSNSQILDGVYFWNWFGFGGPTDGEYTPRGKPSAKAMKRCLESPTWDKIK